MGLNIENTPEFREKFWSKRFHLYDQIGKQEERDHALYEWDRAKKELFREKQNKWLDSMYKPFDN